jgi:GT2 family glycosyltransferase
MGLLLCSIIGAVWAVVMVFFWRALHGLRRLEPATGKSINRRLSVVLPARNEERDLASAIGSLLAQEIEGLEVIVVDDHSTDRTGAIAEEFAARDPRVRVLHDPQLPPGWLGKPNAMHHGATLARGGEILFSDADVIHSRGCLAAAIAEKDRNGLEFLTLFPRRILATFWDNVQLPLYYLSFAVFRRPGLEDPKSPRATASGAFLLIEKQALSAIGGWEALRDAVLDDVRLARRLKERGHKVGARLAPECLHVEFFKTGKDAFWGNLRTFVNLGRTRPSLLIGLSTAYSLLFAAPPLVAAAGAITGNLPLAGVGAAVYLLQYGSFWLARDVMRFQPAKLLAFPLVAAPVLTCMLRVLLRPGRTFPWRGRTVKFEER